MIIVSGNDACVALAEHIAGSEESFVSLMNKYALELGMENTHYTNATGLPDPQHYSTPADILKVTRALIREFPQYYPIYSQRQFTFNGITQKNRNRLLWRDPSVDGVKTGHTKSAGYCLVASAKREGMRLLSVVMGTKSEEARAEESQKLLNYGFRFYQTHRLFAAGEPLKTVRIWKGEREQLPLGLEEDLHVTIPRGDYQKLRLRTRTHPQITAPVRRGQEMGRLIVQLGDEVLADVPLVALADVGEGGMVHNLLDSILQIFE
jgi:D-alanyl-D-alanine carboxypeptidase (penicillin-binding protein 5/6)